MDVAELASNLTCLSACVNLDCAAVRPPGMPRVPGTREAHKTAAD